MVAPAHVRPDSEDEVIEIEGPTTFLTESDLGADELPPVEATIILRGTEIPVELNAKDMNGRLVLVWKSEHGSEVEKEVYFHNEEHFSLSELPQEKFNPPLALIEYPFDIGTESDWMGYVHVGTLKYPAKAKISSASETLKFTKEPFHSVRVTVDLVFNANSAEKTERVLKFWFQPQHGVVKREFHEGSLREPRLDLTLEDVDE